MPGIVENLLNILPTVISGNGEIYSPLQVQEFAIPDKSIGYIHCEINPTLFIPPGDFTFLLESQVNGGAWIPRVKGGSQAALQVGSFPEPQSCDWGYNTFDQPFVGQTLKARFTLRVNGSMLTGISVTKLDLDLTAKPIIVTPPGDTGGI